MAIGETKQPLQRRRAQDRRASSSGRHSAVHILDLCQNGKDLIKQVCWSKTPIIIDLQCSPGTLSQVVLNLVQTVPHVTPTTHMMAELGDDSLKSHSLNLVTITRHIKVRRGHRWVTTQTDSFINYTQIVSLMCIYRLRGSTVQVTNTKVQ